MPKLKNSDNQLGRALIRQQKQRYKQNNLGSDDDHIETENVPAPPVASVTEESALISVLERANIDKLDYDTENKIKIIFTNTPSANLPDKKELDKYFASHKQFLKIPRKPQWTAAMSKEEVQKQEEEALGNWRRSLSVIENEEGTRLTPYEKNIEFWRQLWRVIELSDTIVQIVDARNPLLYYCEDLFSYVNEVGEQTHHPRTSLLLLNKSDLLTDHQREEWRRYFNERNIKAIFWSAKLSEAMNSKNKEETEEPTAGGDSETEQVNEHKEIDFQHTEVLSCEELITLFKQTSNKLKVTVGLVGYPNVGKSATLNSLFQMKKVAVSATPGRTKHLQTLNIDEELTICDCPGLVMPSFAYSQAELIAAGILSIDHMRDCVSPVTVICNQFPRWYLAAHYGFLLQEIREGEDPNRKATAHEFLSGYAHLHGYVTTGGSAHLNRAARYILKDYANGDLLYCYPPPGVNEEEFGAANLTLGKSSNPPKHVISKQNVENCVKLTDFDRKYFVQKQIAGFGYRATKPGGSPKPKELRKEKVKRKEKLRRTFVHLDKHDSD